MGSETMEIIHTKRNFYPVLAPFGRAPLTKQNKAKTKVDGKKLPKCDLEVIFALSILPILFILIRKFLLFWIGKFC